MNSRQLQYAVTLSETLNFSQAAELLGIAQPSLSKQILALESELGVKLFDRKHSPLALTAAGEHFVRGAQDLLYKEEQLHRNMERYRNGENGTLNIGLTPFRSLYLMPGIVKELRRSFPGLKVVLHEVNSAQLRKEALEGRFDFAIVNLPVDTSIADVIPLASDTLVLAVPQSMQHLVGSDATAVQLDFVIAKELPFVVLQPGRELRQLFDNLCTTAGFEPCIASEVNGVTTAWAMARAEVGATLLPLQFVQAQQFDDRLVLYQIKNSLYSRQPAIVTRRGQQLSRYARYAIDLLKHEQYKQTNRHSVMSGDSSAR